MVPDSIIFTKGRENNQSLGSLNKHLIQAYVQKTLRIQQAGESSVVIDIAVDLVCVDWRRDLTTSVPKIGYMV